LKQDEALITKLKINGIDDQFSEQAKSYVAADIQPNSSFSLWKYNNFNKKGNKKNYRIFHYYVCFDSS
jgi:hypothetical protein